MELKKCREHYDTLPPYVKERKTAQHLLTAIQIAERYENELQQMANVLNVSPARVTKQEGE